MRHIPVLLALSAACALPAAVAPAQTPFEELSIDAEAPIEMTSERMTIDREGGRTVMSGGVVVAQDEMRLAAEEVRIFYGTGEAARRITRIEAEGGVTLVSGQDAAEGARAVYDVEGRTVTMEGDVLVTQAAGVIAADSMTVDLETGEAVMEGRVRTVLEAD